MQFIHINSEDEWRENEKSCRLPTGEHVNFAEVLVELFDLEDFDNTYPWISTIDPYGYTIFNHLQRGYLVKELQQLSANPPEYLPVKHIKALIDFITSMEGEHTYLRFSGD